MIIHNFLRNTRVDAIVTPPQPLTNTYTKLTVDTSHITYNPFDVAWDPTGTYLAVTTDYQHECIIYKRNNNTFTFLTALSCPNAPRLCLWDPTGKYLIINNLNSPYDQFFTQNGDTFTSITSPLSVRPTLHGRGHMCFSPDSKFLLWSWYNGFQYYSYQNDTFTSLGTISTNPVYYCRFAWTPDSQYVFMAEPDSYNAHMYKVNGTSLSMLSDTSGTTYCQNAYFSKDGRFLFTTHKLSINSTSFYLKIFSVNNGIISLINSVYITDTGSYTMTINEDNWYIHLFKMNSPYVLTYKFDPDTHSCTQVSTNITTPMHATEAKYDPTGRYLAVVYSTSPYLSIFNLS